MDKFYTYVVIVAFVVLVLALIGLGIILQNQDKGEVFPPIQSKCPDGWANTANGCLIDTAKPKNFGDWSCTILNSADTLYLKNVCYNSTTKISFLEPTGINGTSYEIIFRPEALPCDKRKWANMHGILWDGISNYNQC